MRRISILVLVVAVVLTSMPAAAELPSRGTIGLYLDLSDGNDLSRAGTPKVGDPFELVVVTEAQTSAGAAVFSITELNLLYPGVFKVSTWRFNDSNMEMADNDQGEYAFAYMGCFPAGREQVLRVGYVDVNGDLPEDVVLRVSGIAGDQLHAPALEGAPGYVDCEVDEIFALDPEPWDESSNVDPTLIEGVGTTDGLAVLNPSLRVPVAESSMSTLKAMY
jgi:hypothetical protein